MFTVDDVLTRYYPEISKTRFAAPILRPVLRRLLHERAFLDFAERYPYLQGIEFVEQVLEYFHFSYSVSDHHRINIPSSGKVVIIANHPIGSLDGLVLIKLIHEIRSDVKIVAHALLQVSHPLRPLLLPVRNMSNDSKKEHILRINTALDRSEAVIIFPAGEVSRLTPAGIKDGKWQQGFLKIAERSKAPILPVYIDAQNSGLFYLASIIAKPVSTLMLVKEMFHQRSK